MHFNVKGVNVYVSFTFFAVLLLLTVINENNKFLILAYIFALLHETAHIAVILITNKKSVSKITLSALGAEICTDASSRANYITDIAVNLSGPLLNIVFGALFAALYFIKCCEIFAAASVINIFLGLFNLLPFYSFDGGNALAALLSYKLGSEASNKAITALSLIIAALFSVLTAVFSVLGNVNITAVIVSIYMAVTIFFKK